MDRNVDRSLKLRLIQLLGEQSLAANLGERAVLDHVAAGLDDDDFEMFFRRAMDQSQTAARLMRLRQRQGTAARAYFQPGRQIPLQAILI